MTKSFKTLLISVLVFSGLYIVGNQSQIFGITIPKLDLLYLDGSTMKSRGTWNMNIGAGSYYGDGSHLTGIITDISGLVPYTGATTDVDLGTHNITTTGTGTFGIGRFTTGIKDNAGTPLLSIDSGNRKLYASDGTTLMMDYSNFPGTSSAISMFLSGAGNETMTGNKNFFVGYQSGLANTTGYNNIIIGYRAGRYNATGYNNIFLGEDAGFNNVGGDGNNFIGTFAGLFNVSGRNNNFIGTHAGYTNDSGVMNNFIGYETGYYNTTGGFNVAIGKQAGWSNSTGSNNLFLGSFAGAYETGSDAFYVDDRDRENTAGDKAKALIYGIFADTAATQSITFNVGTASFGSGSITTTGTLGAGAITGTSFIIGGNTLTTTEWAFLDGQDQSVFTTSSPQFTKIGIGVAANATYPLLSSGKSVIGGGVQSTMPTSGNAFLTGSVAYGDVSAMVLYNAGGGDGASVSIDFYNTTGHGNVPQAKIKAVDDGNYSDSLLFMTKNSGWPLGAIAERMRILSYGSVGIGITNKLSSLTVKPVADKTGIGGTTTANAATSIVGSSTGFLQNGYMAEPVGIGDRISLSSASSTYATVLTVTDNTHLTVDTALGNGTSQTINRKKSLFRLDDASAVTQFIVNDLGYVGLGIINPTNKMSLPISNYIDFGASTEKIGSGTAGYLDLNASVGIQIFSDMIFEGRTENYVDASIQRVTNSDWLFWIPVSHDIIFKYVDTGETGNRFHFYGSSGNLEIKGTYIGDGSGLTGLTGDVSQFENDAGYLVSSGYTGDLYDSNSNKIADVVDGLITETYYNP